MTDEYGNKVVERDFTPFGERINTDVYDDEPRDPDEGESGFTGKDWDEDVGLYYYNARWYDPTVGRFISEDSVVDDPSLYVYGANNPLINVDPTGHWNVSINWGSVLTTSISSISPGLGQVLGGLSTFKFAIAGINQLQWASFLKKYSSMNPEDFKAYLKEQGIDYKFAESNTQYKFLDTTGQKPLKLTQFGSIPQRILIGDQKLAYFKGIQGNIKAFLENNPGLTLEQVKGLFDSAVISADNPWGFGKNEFRYEGRGSNYKGLYNAEAVVMNEGMVLGVFTRANTIPDDPNNATVDENIYNYSVTRHHYERHKTEVGQPAPKDDKNQYYTYSKIKVVDGKITTVQLPIDKWHKGAYKALNLTGDLAGGRLPAMRGGKRGAPASAINSHAGGSDSRWSEGCMTMYIDDYVDYINLFNWNDTGKFIISR